MSAGIDQDSTKARARRRLDEKLRPLQPVERFVAPSRGWIRAIRTSLGMSGKQLAARLRVTPQNVDNLERSEANGSIRISTLKRVAEALDCTVVYALVPKTSLDEIVWTRARKIAREEIARVSHSMTLEDQRVDRFSSLEEVERYVRQHVREKDIWEHE